MGRVRVYGGLDLVPLVVVVAVKVPRVLQRQFRVHMGSDLAADEPAVCMKGFLGQNSTPSASIGSDAGNAGE